MLAQTRCGRPVTSGKVPAAVCGLLLACASAHASVAVLLEQPYGKLGIFDTAGHSAIYLDHVCAESPTVLRPCREGELGVVVSRYDGIGHFDWLAMPLMSYLYAVGMADEIPATMDRATEVAMRDRYRRAHLEAVAPDTADGNAPDGNWYELVGAAYDRTIYGFSVKTTAEQDAKLIALFNDRKNVERYNGFFANCADFSRTTINHFYPHAVRRNFIADFGITSPKSVARGLAHYSSKHSEAGLQVFMIPQVKGDLPRSHPAQDVAEGILKRYSVPLVVLSPTTTAVVFAAYVGHGRFSMPKDAVVLDLHDETATAFLEAEPVVDLTAAKAPAATATEDPARATMEKPASLQMVMMPEGSN
jgi:hypothetical protein